MRGVMLGLLLAVVGCADAAEIGIGLRGLGLADGVLGSCVDACGDAAAAGNCWCDEACVEHGDCCADKVDACGGDAPSPPPPALCWVVEDCPVGLTCDASACDSACRGGEACEDDCVGRCVEPSQQSLPDPTAPDAPTPDDGPSDDPGDEPVPSADCSCPEGDLCVPLCPVCPPEIPDEDCQCSTVCVRL